MVVISLRVFFIDLCSDNWLESFKVFVSLFFGRVREEIVSVGISFKCFMEWCFLYGIWYVRV